MRRTGHIPDPPEVVKRRAPLHLHPKFGAIRARATALPTMTTNRAFMSTDHKGPGIPDQDGVGGCEGEAHATGGTLLLAIQGLSQGRISEAQLYLGALMVDSSVQPDGTLSPITDTGTGPSSILTAWGIFGAELAANDPQCPISTATMYQNPADPNSQLILPTQDALYNDSAYRYQGAYFIVSVGTQRYLDIFSTLADGRPISDAIPASGPEFQGYSGGVLGMLSGDIDHANLIVDYEWTGSITDWSKLTSALASGDSSTAQPLLSSGLILHCVNSWGTGWGEGDTVSGMPGGMYRANVAYLDQAESLCTLDLRAAA